MTPLEQFNTYGALLIKDVIPKDLVHFLTHVLQRASHYSLEKEDTQVPNTLGLLDHELITDTVLERVWPYIEQVLGEELLPTYSYSRLYTNGNVLEKHTDRPSCEISMTVQLGRSHHYAWPIYMGSKRFDLAEGDGVIYRGCDVEHWRDACDGPDGYITGQIFLHYVRKNGPYIEFAGDQRNWPTPEPFKKYTHWITETK